MAVCNKQAVIQVLSPGKHRRIWFFLFYIRRFYNRTYTITHIYTFIYSPRVDLLNNALGRLILKSTEWI
jgi:hypothetical protein